MRRAGRSVADACGRLGPGRAGRGVGREVDGTGAGLAIVRQVTDRHGGRSWMEAREGGGSVFYATFGPAPLLEVV